MMNRIQKIAWFMLITIAAGVLVSAAAVGILYFRIGMPRALAGFGFLGIAGIGGLGPLFFKKDRGKVVFDERDNLIKSRAALASFAMCYLYFGIACMTPFGILGPEGVISVRWLPRMYGIAGLITFFVWSLMIVLQYGRGGRDAAE